MKSTKSTATKVTPRIDFKKMKSLGILSFDFDNKYPQRVIDISNDSPTAVTSLNIFTKFVKGRGLVDEDLGKMKVNRDGLTVNKLLQKAAKSKGRFKGIAFHINYNALGEKTEVQFVPFEYCRLADPDGKEKGKIALYDDWGQVKHKTLKKKEIKYIHKYNPQNVFHEVASIEVDTKDKSPEDIMIEKWSKYEGQIFYWTPDGTMEYVLSPFDSVLEEMQTEAQIKRFKHGTSSKNFLASHILVTAKAETDEDEVEFEENLKSFQGGDAAGKIFWLQRENADDEIDLQKVDIQSYDDLYDYTEKSARGAIHRQFLIPPVLLLASKGGIGQSKELSDATLYYNNVTDPDRDDLKEVFTELFKDFKGFPEDADYSILEIKYSDIVAFNYDAATLKEINLIITDDTMSPEDKKGTLKVVYGFKDEQLNQMFNEKMTPGVQ